VPAKNWQYWQRWGVDPAPAQGAAAATPGVLISTENGARAMAAAAAIAKAFIW
jgi:hypothetical protein